MTVGGGSDTFDLRAGDVLVSFNQDETILAAYAESGTDTLYGKRDLMVFRPATPGDYASGTFSMLLDDLVPTNLRGISLVEHDTTVGGTPLTAGTFLFVQDTLPDVDIYHFTPTGVGAGTTAGTTVTLIDGSDINIDSGPIRGIELIESPMTVGGMTFQAGSILATLRFDDASVGSNNLLTLQQDVFVLNVTSTGIGTTAATAQMVLDGGDVNLDNNPGA